MICVGSISHILSSSPPPYPSASPPLRPLHCRRQFPFIFHLPGHDLLLYCLNDSLRHDAVFLIISHLQLPAAVCLIYGPPHGLGGTMLFPHVSYHSPPPYDVKAGWDDSQRLGMFHWVVCKHTEGDVIHVEEEGAGVVCLVDAASMLLFNYWMSLRKHYICIN